jgi:acetoacetate decarboxylase
VGLKLPTADLGLPILAFVSGTNIIADFNLDLGKVVHDYLS